jgi:hypothetical protein
MLFMTRAVFSACVYNIELIAFRRRSDWSRSSASDTAGSSAALFQLLSLFSSVYSEHSSIRTPLSLCKPFSNNYSSFIVPDETTLSMYFKNFLFKVNIGKYGRKETAMRSQHVQRRLTCIFCDFLEKLIRLR